jgi:Domain of unknown function (DUF6894)
VRYFFHVVDGTTSYRDHAGQTCASRVAAGTRAAQIARDLAADSGSYPGFTVSVADERGNEVARVPVG